MKNKRKTILCDAKAFCFGPIAKLLVISEILHKKYNIIFLVSGTSKILGDVDYADKIIECNTENIDDLKRNEDLFLKADLFINIMNPVSSKFAAQRKVPMIQIDSLFWMWQEIPKEILDSDIYFIQNFDGIDKQMQKYKNKIRNPIIVGPIVKQFEDKIIKKNKLIINFGGMESASVKVGINTNYPFVIAKLLDEVLSKNESFDEIKCCGNKDILKKINKILPNSKIKFEFFEHEKFLKEISESRMIISSPGLTTAFESFSAGTPMFFLPPQNYSQYWNLDTFSNNQISGEALNWNNLYPDTKIIKNEEQIIGIKKVLDCVEKFENDEENKNKLKSYINRVVKSTDSELNNLTKKQKKYLESIGGNGLIDIIDNIDVFLNKK